MLRRPVDRQLPHRRWPHWHGCRSRTNSGETDLWRSHVRDLGRLQRVPSRFGVRPCQSGLLPMRQNLLAQELHARYCPAKNTKSALFLVAYFSVAAFENWKGLQKAPEHLDLVSLSFVIIVLAMLAKSLVNFSCVRERLVFVLVIVSFVLGEVYGFFPAIVGPYAYMLKPGELTLSLLGVLVSLSMLVQSALSPRVEPTKEQTAIAKQMKRTFLILPAVILAILVLGALLYFLPFRR